MKNKLLALFSAMLETPRPHIDPDKLLGVVRLSDDQTPVGCLVTLEDLFEIDRAAGHRRIDRLADQKLRLMRELPQTDLSATPAYARLAIALDPAIPVRVTIDRTVEVLLTAAGRPWSSPLASILVPRALQQYRDGRIEASTTTLASARRVIAQAERQKGALERAAAIWNDNDDVSRVAAIQRKYERRLQALLQQKVKRAGGGSNEVLNIRSIVIPLFNQLYSPLRAARGWVRDDGKRDGPFVRFCHQFCHMGGQPVTDNHIDEAFRPAGRRRTAVSKRGNR